jgi:hypothetical protein
VKNKLLLSPLALLLLSALFLMVFSCEKNDDNDLGNTVSSEVGQFESILTDADNMLGQVWQGDGSIEQRLSSPAGSLESTGCATVTHDTSANSIVIDFGSGCTGLDGRTRAGRILISYTGAYFVAGSSHVMTFDAFYVDGRHIEGVRTITNTGTDNAGNMAWNVQATNMRITFSGGNWRTWNSTRTRTLIGGAGNNNWLDDVYRINGTGSGSNSNGQSFSAVISSLIRNNSCRWITAGSISISPSGKPTRIIDFGSGNCDDQATVSIGNRSVTITLR